MTQRAACAIAVRTDRVGKVFILIQGNGKWLICDQVFTPQESAKHANVMGWPEKRDPRSISERLNGNATHGRRFAELLGIRCGRNLSFVRSFKPVSGQSIDVDRSVATSAYKSTYRLE